MLAAIGHANKRERKAAYLAQKRVEDREKRKNGLPMFAGWSVWAKPPAKRPDVVPETKTAAEKLAELRDSGFM